MVTADELKDLAYLSEEIASIDQTIETLKRPSYLRDMVSYQRAECAAALTELIALYQDRRQMCAAQLEKLRVFMDGIDDPFTRELFHLRYDYALEWGHISRIMIERGFYYADESLRQICKRYLERYNRNEASTDETGTTAVL